MSPRKDEPSTSPPSKYRLLTTLGEGATGVVHLAVSRGPGGFVKLAVLKLLRRELVFDATSRQMFLEEARISARLAHANIVSVFEVTEHEGQPAIVMEYLDGRPLSDFPSDGVPPLPLDLHLYVLAEMAAGLHAAHELQDFDGAPMGLVHRDVSPHNVFLLFDGRVKVLDFGIAKAHRSPVHTETGLLKGKVRYMAPEQLGGEGVDRRADVFAGGVMLHRALTGQPLWEECSEGEVLRRLANHAIPELPPSDGMDEGLRELRGRALAGARDERLPTAAQLREGILAHFARRGPSPSAADLSEFMITHLGADRQRRRQDLEALLRTVEQERDDPRRGEPRAPIVAPEAPSSSVRPSRWRWAVPLFGALGLAAAGLWLVPRKSLPEPPGFPATVTERSPSSCPAGTKPCGETCVSLDLPDRGCAANICTPCAVPHATPRCDAGGQCAISICHPGFEDCDGDPSNGCETNIRIDPAHCGGCEQACPAVPNAVSGCGDVCTIWRCTPGFRDCNDRTEDGCETAVTANGAHCGSCGNRCGPNERCEDSVCRRLDL